MTDHLLHPELVVALLRDAGDCGEQLLDAAHARGDALWLDAGAMERTLRELAAALAADGVDDAGRVAGERLKALAARVNWLAVPEEAGSGHAASRAPANPCAARFESARRRLGGDAVLLTVADRAYGRAARDYLDLGHCDDAVRFIDLARQQRSIRSRVERGLSGVLRHGRYVGGPEIDELERRLARRCGAAHAVAVSSGTDALLVALLAAGVKAGDEVITTPFSFAAAAEMVLLLGARPVYVDIDPVTYNLDPSSLEAAVGAKTRAVVPVGVFGQCPDMDAINAVAARHGLVVIEDAAQSFGATYRGRKSCALSDLACTSFFPSKPLGGYGEGGACFTGDDRLAAAMRQIRDHGQDGRYRHARLGVNARMSSFQASVLLCKLDVFEDELRLRARAAARYAGLLAERGAGRGLDVIPPRVAEGNVSTYAQYSVLVEGRDAVQERLRAAGIPTAVHYPRPLYRQPAFLDAVCEAPVSEDVCRRVLSLPMHPYLTRPQQERVVARLAEAVGAGRGA